MKRSLRNRTSLGCLLTAALCIAPTANAQDFPNKPIRWVVPYAPGGATDLIARVISQKIIETLGQTVIVDNRPGAGSAIGTELVARAQPDGYTILLATIATHAINPYLQNVRYDPFKDFSPIILVARGPFLVVVNPGLPASSMKEFVALAKAKPGALAFGSGGPGSPQHLSVEIFKSVAGVDLTHVPYKGSGPALTEVIGGQIQFMFDNTAMQHVKATRLRAIASTGTKRMAIAPDVPTVRESGIPYDFYAWQGVAAPGGTPAPIVNKLNAAIAKALPLPDVQAKLTSDGAELAGGTPQQFADYIKSENARMQKAVHDSGASNK
jgi:tripartite-type tricarboxylate transporter receptor subunit TctC